MTMPNDDELLPCPFCGGYADLDYYHNENDDGGGRGKVICTDCGVEAVGEDKGWMSNEADKSVSKGEAVAMWNRRVEPAEVLALRKRVEAADADRRMIVSHATMGSTTGEGMIVNDISVMITRLRNEMYAAGEAHARAEFKKQASDAIMAATHDAQSFEAGYVKINADGLVERLDPRGIWLDPSDKTAKS